MWLAVDDMLDLDLNEDSSHPIASCGFIRSSRIHSIQASPKPVKSSAETGSGQALIADNPPLLFVVVKSLFYN